MPLYGAERKILKLKSSNKTTEAVDITHSIYTKCY